MQTNDEQQLTAPVERLVRMLHTPPEVLNPELLKPRKRRVLLIASYCGEDNPECTEDRPCTDCLRMCNVADVVIGLDDIIGSFE